MYVCMCVLTYHVCNDCIIYDNRYHTTVVYQSNGAAESCRPSCIMILYYLDRKRAVDSKLFSIMTASWRGYKIAVSASSLCSSTQVQTSHSICCLQYMRRGSLGMRLATYTLLTYSTAVSSLLLTITLQNWPSWLLYQPFCLLRRDVGLFSRVGSFSGDYSRL